MTVAEIKKTIGVEKYNQLMAMPYHAMVREIFRMKHDGEISGYLHASMMQRMCFDRYQH